MSTAGSGSTPQTQSSSSSPRDDWSRILDPNERRRIQNRLAQRKYREKVRTQREEDTKREYDIRMAGASYSPPDPEQMGRNAEADLPWGSFSLRHIVRTGQERAQQAQQERFAEFQAQRSAFAQQHPTQQQQYSSQMYRPGVGASRYSSSTTIQPYQSQHYRYDVDAAMRSGGPSSVGLHLANDYARASPLWQAWTAQIPTTSAYHSSSVTTDSSMPSDWS